MSYDNLIFDGDDTLWKCGIYYKEAKDEFVKYQTNRTKLPPEFIRKLVSDIDLACISLPNAFSRFRMPRSYSAASAALDFITGAAKVDEKATRKSYQIGNSVFEAEYELHENVVSTLVNYVKNGKNIFLLTKGDETVQWDKLWKHDLPNFVFPINNIHVVPQKDAVTLTKLLECHNLDENKTVYIGDSLRDDVGVANEVGVTSVWINHADVQHWDYENTDHVPHYTISEVSQLPSIIPFK